MKNLSLELYKKMYLIRQAEQAIIEQYPYDEMKTPMHMSMGGEAIAVGVCAALAKNDQVIGTYRSHALYLAKAGETDKFFAEMYGKATGMAKGKAGSMHLSAPEKGLFASSAVVASNLPVAVGAAYANKVKGQRRVVAVFFGDGALEEGNFWESLNLACVMRVPLLFICEDNGLSMHTSKRYRQGFDSIVDIASRFHCQAAEENTTDVERIYGIVRKAVKKIGTNPQPFFLRFSYYRYLEHVGIYSDFDAGYRSRREFNLWRQRDPLDMQKEKLLKSGIKKGTIHKVEKRLDQQIEHSIRLAKRAPFPSERELYTDVLYEF